MSHYASTLPESISYQEPDTSFLQECIQESSQEPFPEESLCYKGDPCSKGCLCPTSQEEEPRSITIENEAGDKIVLKAYSTKTENRISINTVDMSFYEFKGYLADIGMVDDYDMIEKKHWQDIKIISTCSAFLGALSVMAIISWFLLLAKNLSRLR